MIDLEVIRATIAVAGYTRSLCTEVERLRKYAAVLADQLSDAADSIEGEGYKDVADAYRSYIETTP